MKSLYYPFPSTSTGSKRTRLVSWAVPAMLAGLAAVLSGCASVGHDFNTSAVDQLDFGSIQASDYRSVFGEKPTATTQTTTADGRFEVARYSYTYADMGTAKARILILEFKDGKLNAFIHLSSFAQDQTQTPADKLDQIKSGVSTKADVLKIFGKPNGKALCPSTLQDFKESCEKCVEVWKWNSLSSLSTFGAAYGGQKPSVKSISIGFDKDGVVSKTSTSSSNDN